MVKPTLNLDKKVDLKTPDGSLVKVITVNDAPSMQAPVYLATRSKAGCRAAKVLCTLLCTLISIMLMFMLVMYLFSPYTAGYFTCGVGYYDDGEYYGQDYGQDYFDSWSSEGAVPYGSDMLFAPRPTGAPLLRYLEERVDINLDLRFIRINPPSTSDLSGVSVLHDFDLSLTAYLVPSSGVCYIRPLNLDSTLTPEDFESLLQSEAYKNQEYPVSHEIYAVNPDEVVTEVGDHIGELCEGYTQYYIHSVPTDQLSTFWQTAQQVVRDRFPNRPRHGGRHDDSDSDSDSSSAEEEERRLGSRSRSRSSSSEEIKEFNPRRRFMRGFIDKIQSFDGQRVVDIRVFQVHNLEGLSEEDLARLMAFRDGVIMP